MAAPLHRLEVERGTPVNITLHGEVDASNAVEVEAEVRRELGGEEVRLVLSELTFIDSSGLAMLGRVTGDGAAIAVVAPPGSAARRVIEIVGMGPGLPLVDEPPD